MVVFSHQLHNHSKNKHTRTINTNRKWPKRIVFAPVRLPKCCGNHASCWFSILVNWAVLLIGESNKLKTRKNGFRHFCITAGSRPLHIDDCWSLRVTGTYMYAVVHYSRKRSFKTFMFGQWGRGALCLNVKGADYKIFFLPSFLPYLLTYLRIL